MPAEPQHLLHVFSTFAVGGPEVRFTTVANRLGRRFRHTIVAMDGKFDCAARLDASLDVDLVGVPPGGGRGLSPGRLAAFARMIGERRPDSLLTYNWGAIEWALVHRLRPRSRHVHFEDGFGPDEADGRQIPRRVWFRRLSLTGRTRVVVPSRLLERIAKEVWRLDRKRVEYVPNGVDIGRFAPRRATLAGLRPGALVVGTVGAQRAEKNYARLIRAFAALPRKDVGDAGRQLVLVGDGPERPALEALARRLGVQDDVLFPGSLARPEDALAAFDVYALSSDTEQMPISLLEATAAGLPVVATDVGDVRAMLAPENDGFVVPKTDEHGFGRALSRLLGDPALRGRIGEANRERTVAEYDLDRMVASYERLFTS
ncbi:glycosyltransferase family 4 protein [Arenibaculum pallidiluteum]|uniref:glycosyltransferase family 4 protein n=1 Tax=Arenibaculum pallidiluteum TaxID=2812559 RepID=UPI001A95B0BD|nr:glycosyltransferase family 4 protein [Arenibaculum pallidiluteum]